jgi:antitoxin ParD1/3/4
VIGDLPPPPQGSRYDIVIALPTREDEGMARTSPPITITLGELRERVEARVKSGAYASVSEVMRAAVRALDREEAAVTEWLRERVEEAFADPRPDIPAREVFQHLRERHAARLKAERDEDI